MTTARSERTPQGARIRRRRIRLPSTTIGRRSLALTVVFVVVFLVVVGRLVSVQVLDAERWAVRGAEQRSRVVELPAQRGRLYDRQGDVLATSVDSATVYADPRRFRSETTPDGLVKPPAMEPAEAAEELASVLDRPAAEIETLLRQDSHFVYLGRQLDWEIGQRVLALDVPGVGVLTEPHRVYPGGGLAGQVVGFTGIDGAGLHGLELQHDSLLRGTPGQLVAEKAPGGLDIASGVRELAPPTPGTDLVLTIDREIQYVAEQAAADAVAAYDAVGASVVVLDVATGEVLAMASAPGFDPNELVGDEKEAWRNRAVTDVFEPGSVQKAVTAAAVLEDGIATPDSTYEVADEIEVGGKRFSDSHEHPTEEMTFRRIIETSSNVGTIMVAQELGADRLHHYLREFGYGQTLGTGFPGEAPGLLMPVENWWKTSLPTIAIGQGVATTLLQAASFYATIANGGVAVSPRILRGTVGEDGRLEPLAAEGGGRRIISTRTATQLREILGGVVAADHGTGQRAAIAGYEAAGKTGTARKPKVGERGYSGQYVATFVGFAPVDEPRLVVAVMVDEPYPIWGGVVAAPVFSEVMGFALKHQQVSPAATTRPLDDALTDATRTEQEWRAQRERERREAQREQASEDDTTAAGP